MLAELNQAIQKGKARDAKELVIKLLESGVAAKTILEEGLLSAMSVVGVKFKNNEVFVPEVLIAARALNLATAELKPALVKAGVKPIGKAAICTVKGDLHDIGKNLVKMMLEGVGIEVIDMGVNASAEKIIQTIEESHPKIICLSALLTTTMSYQKVIIGAIKEAGLRDKVVVMIGGAPVTQEFADSIGADYYTPDAASAAEVAKSVFTYKVTSKNLIQN